MKNKNFITKEIVSEFVFRFYKLLLLYSKLMVILNSFVEDRMKQLCTL